MGEQTHGERPQNKQCSVARESRDFSNTNTALLWGMLRCGDTYTQAASTDESSLLQSPLSGIQEYSLDSEVMISPKVWNWVIDFSTFSNPIDYRPRTNLLNTILRSSLSGSQSPVKQSRHPRVISTLRRTPSAITLELNHWNRCGIRCLSIPSLISDPHESYGPTRNQTRAEIKTPSGL